MTDSTALSPADKAFSAEKEELKALIDGLPLSMRDRISRARKGLIPKKATLKGKANHGNQEIYRFLEEHKDIRVPEVDILEGLKLCPHFPRDEAERAKEIHINLTRNQTAQYFRFDNGDWGLRKRVWPKKR